MSKEQELNDYLAEEIMGWNLTEPKWSIEKESVFKHYQTEGRKELNYTTERYIYNGYEIWNPLENLEQAFEVLEEYCPDDWYWHLEPRKGGYCQCQFNLYETGWGKGWHEGDTKPKAIIGAILKTKSKYDEFKECFTDE